MIRFRSYRSLLGFAALVAICAAMIVLPALAMSPIALQAAGVVAVVASCAFTFLLIRSLLLEQHRLTVAYLRELTQTPHGSWQKVPTPDYFNMGDCGPLFAELINQHEQAGTLKEQANQLRAKAELKATRIAAEAASLTDIVARLSQPVVAINQYDEIVVANPAAQELFGFQFSQGTSTPAREVIDPALVELMHSMRRHQGDSHRSLEWTKAKPSGEEQVFRVSCRKSVAETSEAAGAVAVFSNVSDRKAIQKRHAEFVSSVSHEMKTPLTGIKAYVELLADGDAEDDATREEFLEVINSQADRLQRLIDNLLNIARIEAGVVSVHKQNQSLNELLEEAFAVVLPAAEQKQITLKADLSPLYLGTLADRDMLLQSAINLLSNAIKYTQQGGSVTLRSRTGDNGVEFEVEDTGVGLGEEEQIRVFEKFYRVTKDSNMAAGTGLGLPLAKHIVEEVHGGSLRVASKVGKGSTFKVLLPAVFTSA